MSTSQTFASWVSVTQNGNYNQATCQPSAYHIEFRHEVPTNHKPVCAMTSERDQPTSQANVSHIMPTTRRLLAEAHQTMFPESRQFGHDATAMDMVLDHRLLICVADQPADGHRHPAVLRSYTPRCQAEIDAYSARQEERGEFVSPMMRKNIEPPISAERSTMTWPPNLDGNDVWDYAS